MLGRLKELYLAKFELAKLEGIDKVSNVLAKLVTICMVVVMLFMIGLAGLLLISVWVGFLFSSALISVLTFGVLILISSSLVIIFRKRVLYVPIKDKLINSIYNETT